MNDHDEREPLLDRLVRESLSNPVVRRLVEEESDLHPASSVYDLTVRELMIERGIEF